MFDQSEFDVRCEWGMRGMRELAPISDVVLIVDVLSFSTAVDVATARGAVVFPYPLRDEAAASYAESMGAHVAARGRAGGFSLSPASLMEIPARYRLVLPSPNGGRLCFEAAARNLIAACLRNARAAAAAATRLGSTFAVIPAGEMWDSGELRPSVEDLIGAGSIIANLPGRKSPDAEMALAAFARFRGDLHGVFSQCGSGKELIARGFATDVEIAGEYAVSDNVPLWERGFVGLR